MEPASVVAKAWEHVERIGQRAVWQPRTRAGHRGRADRPAGGADGPAARAGGPRPGPRRPTGRSRSWCATSAPHYHTGAVKDLAAAADVVIECTGVGQLVFDIVGDTPPGGIICLTGISSGGRPDPGGLRRAEQDDGAGERRGVRLGERQPPALRAGGRRRWRRPTRRGWPAGQPPRSRWTDWQDALGAGAGRRQTGSSSSPNASRDDPHGLAHRGLRPDRRLPDGRAGRHATGRSTGSACRGSTPGPASPPCSATPENGRWLLAPQGDGASRPPPVPRRHAGPGDRVRDRRRAWSRSSTACRSATTTPDLVRIVEGRRGRVPMRMELVDAVRLRLDRPLGAARDGGIAAIAGPDAVLPPHAGPSRTARTSRPSPSSPCRAGERVPFVLTWHPSHRAAARAASTREAALRETAGLVATSGPALHLRRAVARAGRAVAHHPQGADLRADRRDRGRGHDLAARAPRRRAQLGLPLLLAARRHVHAARAPELPATPTRPGPGASGCCGPWPATRASCRSCTAWAASGG